MSAPRSQPYRRVGWQKQMERKQNRVAKLGGKIDSPETAKPGPKSVPTGWVKTWREEHNHNKDFSQKDAAGVLGVDLSSYQNWERGRSGVGKAHQETILKRDNSKDPRLRDFQDRLRAALNEKAPVETEPKPEELPKPLQAECSAEANQPPAESCADPSTQSSDTSSRSHPNQTPVKFSPTVAECFRKLGIAEAEVPKRFRNSREALLFLLRQALHQEESGHELFAWDIHLAAKEFWFLYNPGAPTVLQEIQGMVELYSGNEFHLTDRMVEVFRGLGLDPEHAAARLQEPDGQPATRAILEAWKRKLENPHWTVLAAEEQRQLERLKRLHTDALSKAPPVIKFSPKPRTEVMP